MLRNEMQTVREVASFVREWVLEKNECSDCMCGWASGMIHQLLAERGVSAKIVCNIYHAFVLVDDYVVDVTADQFSWYDCEDYLPVMITEEKTVNRKTWWETIWTYDSVEDFITHQKEHEWPTEQFAIKLTETATTLRRHYEN